MAKLKAGQLNQILFTLVDKVDFASVESTVTSGFTQRLWGVRHGTSAAAVAKTPSKAISVVRSGIFRATLKASESSDFDYFIYEVEHASCATQIMPFELVFSDDSDMLSALTLLHSAVSDTYSAMAQGNSRILLTQSRVSDIQSFLSDMHSDVLSYLIGMSGMLSDIDSSINSRFSDIQSLLTTTGVQLNASTMSDIRSALGDISLALTASDISDIASAVAAAITTVTPSDISDIASAVWAHVVGARIDSRVLLLQSQASNVYSQVSSIHSDLRSLVILGVGVTLSAMSDIASNVWIHPIGSRVDSRLLLTQSMVSDVHSLLNTGMSLDASTMSDLRSAIAGTTATLTLSDISDIASAVWANNVGARIDSRVTLNLSRISDVYSALSDMHSDLRSLVTTTGVQLNASTMSDIRSALGDISLALTASDISDIASAVAAAVTVITPSNISDIASAVYQILHSDISDIMSSVQQINSRAFFINASQVSEIHAILSDMYSDFQSRVPKAVATSSQVSNLQSDLRSFLTIMSGIQSDMYSLIADGVTLNASTMSDLRSAITAGGGGALTVSNISDIASAVWADITGARIDSRVALNQSRISDVSSSLSDLHSDLRSYMAGLSGMLSDVHSGVVQANSRVVAQQSVVSDIYSLLNDVKTQTDSFSDILSDIYSGLSNFHSDFDSRFPATIPELSGDPGATPTWADAEALQFMWLRNNSKTTTTKRLLRNNAGAIVLSGLHAETAGESYVQGKLG